MGAKRPLEMAKTSGGGDHARLASAPAAPLPSSLPSSPPRQRGRYYFISSFSPPSPLRANAAIAQGRIEAQMLVFISLPLPFPQGAVEREEDRG